MWGFDLFEFSLIWVMGWPIALFDYVHPLWLRIILVVPWFLFCMAWMILSAPLWLPLVLFSMVVMVVTDDA